MTRRHAAWQTTPGTIANLTATPSAGKITIKWSVSSGAAQYHLMRYVDGGWSGISNAITGTSRDDTNVVAGKSYKYRVRGRNGDVFGAWKESAAVTAK